MDNCKSFGEFLTSSAYQLFITKISFWFITLMNKKQTDKRTLCNSPNDLMEWLGSTTIKDKASGTKCPEFGISSIYFFHVSVHSSLIVSVHSSSSWNIKFSDFYWEQSLKRNTLNQSLSQIPQGSHQLKNCFKKSYHLLYCFLGSQSDMEKVKKCPLAGF